MFGKFPALRSAVSATLVVVSVVSPTAALAAGLDTRADAVILSNTANGSFTSVTGPIIDNIDFNDMNPTSGTITLTAPAGFEFDTGGVAPTVVVTCTTGACSGTPADNVNNLASGSSITLTVSASTLTATITDDVDDGENSLTWQNVRIRPTVDTAMVADIIIGGTVVISGGAVDTGSDVGTLKEIGFAPATGGSAIGDNTVGGAWTSLTGPYLSEAETGDIGDNGAGTIILNVPSGFEFDTGGVAPTVLITRTGGSGADSRNINNVTSGTSYAMTSISSTQLTFTVVDETSNGVTNSLTWQNIRVRPTAALPLASGNITKTGASVIEGVTNSSTNFGTLTEIDASSVATTTVVTSDADPSTYGDTVTLTATVTGSSPTGTVEFFNGMTSIGTGAVVAGQAQLAINTLTAGSHSITAQYSGDGGNDPSTSAIYTQDVDTASLTITATSTVKTYNDTVTFVGTEFGTTGLVLSDSVASVTLTSAGAASTATVAGSPYSIVPSAAVGSGLSNYTINYVNGTLTVNQAPMTVTANNAAKNYGTVFTFVGNEFFTTGTFYNGDNITSVTLTSAGASSGATVGGSPYSIVPSAATGSGVTNYSITYVNGTLTVNQAGTVTSTVLDAPTTSIVGESVQFDVVISGTDLTGTVSFKDDGVIIGTGAVVAGTATFSTSALAVGNHPMTATYNGDSNNLPSTSAVADVHVVDKDSADTVTTVSSSDPVIVGTPIILTASVSGAYLPTGTVEFYSGAVLIGSGTLVGTTATLNHTFVVVGAYSVTAHYVGDGNNNASTSPVEQVLVQDVIKDGPDTVTNVGVSNPSIVGDNVVFTATVTGAFNPTGGVEFYSGAVLLGSGTLVGTTATFNHVFTVVGEYSITAHYLGDGNNNASTSPVEIVEIQTVEKASPDTSTVMTVTPSTIGDMVTMTATVSGGYNPAGQVVFRDGIVILATVPLSGGTATFDTDLLAVGDHDLTAEYLGDGNNNGSTSPVVHTHVVQKMTSTSLFASMPNPNSVHIDLLMGVNVSGYNPTGTVEFFENGVSLGTAPLILGRATFSASPNLGSYTYTAVYSGDMNNFPSTSNGVPVEIVDTPDNEPGSSNGGAGASNGSGRGSGLSNAVSVANFAAKNNGYGNAAPPAFGGDDVPLSRQELNYICAVKRAIPSGTSDEFLEQLAAIMGQLIGRSTEFVFEQLNDNSLCDAVNEARYGKGRLAYADLIAFPVALDGLPTSDNEAWNACIRGTATLEQIRSNPDRNEYRRAGVSLPRTCGHYHTKNSWYHPELGVHFEFNGRGFILPVGYIAIPQKGVAQK